MTYLLLIFCLLVASSAKRIVGGRDVTQSEYDRTFPFLAQSSSRWSMHCTNSVLDRRWILTAAHCVDSSVTTIRVGDVRAMSGTAYNIVQQIPHPNFSWITLANDIALIQVDRDIDAPIAQIAGVNYFHSINYQSRELTMVGWGAAGSQLPAPTILQTAQTNHNPNCRFTGDICVQGFGGTGACYGDSGGPLLFNGIQIGVVSRGEFDPPPICENGIVIYASTEFHGAWVRSVYLSAAALQEPQNQTQVVAAELTESCMSKFDLFALQASIPLLESALKVAVADLTRVAEAAGGDHPEIFAVMEHLAVIEGDLVGHLNALSTMECPLCSDVQAHFDQTVNDLVVWMSVNIDSHWESDPTFQYVSLLVDAVRSVGAHVC